MTKNKDRLNNWKQFEELVNFSGIPFPTPDDYWEVIDAQNPDTQLVVWLAQGPWDKQKAAKSELSIVKQYPYGPKPLIARQNYVHILKVELNKDKAHYFPISDITKVLPRTTNGHKRNLCRNCHRVSKPLTEAGIRELDLHERACTGDKSIIDLPADGAWDSEMKFTAFKKLLRAPYVGYGDFEVYNVEKGILEKFPATEEGLKGMTTKHVLSGGRYMIIGPDKKVWCNRVVRFKPTGTDGQSIMEDGRRLGREFLLQVFADCKKVKALMREVLQNGADL